VSLRADKPPRYITIATQANSASYPQGTGKEHRPECSAALRQQGTKGLYDLFHLWINVWLAGKGV